MKPVFETARMYLGKAPQMPIQKIFGMTALQVG